MMFNMTSQTQERIPAVTLKWRLQMSLDMGNLSVEEIASLLDVSRSTVSRWLNGRGAAPKRPFLIQWALATGVPVAWLETGVGEAGDDPDPGPGVDAEALAKLTNSKRSRSGRDTQEYLSAA